MNLNHFLALYRQERIDPVIVCNLPASLVAMIGAKVTRVYLSTETLDKQRRRHPDMTEAHYRALAAALRNGEYRQDSPRTAVVLFVDARLNGLSFRAYVKSTDNGKEIYVTSFCVVGKRQYRAELRRPYPVIRKHLQI
jgi:hypothetical protein